MRHHVVAAIIVIVGLCIAWLGLVWSLGVPPYVYIAKFLYNDVPRIEVPVRLRANEPFAFQLRILEKRNYLLNLSAHFDSDAERSAARAFIGGPLSAPHNLAHPPGTLTVFNITVCDSKGRVLHESHISSDGRNYITAKSVGRKIGEFVLDPGIYDISVTLLNDIPELTKLETSLEVTYSPKSFAIR